MGVEDLKYIGNTFVPEWTGCPEPRSRSSASATPERSSAWPSVGLGVGFIGSGFNARFHMQSWPGVRDADVLGVWSPNRKNAESRRRLRAVARRRRRRSAYRSIADMVADPAIDAIWLSGPNQARIENVEEIVDTIVRGHGELRGIACEKPLARNVAEAKQVAASRVAKAPGSRTATSRTSSSRPQVERGPRAALGPRRRDSPAGRTWPAPPRSTAVRTCPGSGAASCRAAACSTT